MKRTRILIAAASLALVVTVPAVAADKSVQSAGIIHLAVSFEVLNVNRSNIPCEADGKTYTVRGHITGQRKELKRPGRALAMYLHGGTLGEFQWRLPVAGYDVVDEMAMRGHISLTIDGLGYDSSDHPDGTQVCKGSEADIAHQIVVQLKNGTYGVGGAAPVRFARVALGGQSQGGATAQIEASSFGDIDALFQIGVANTALPTPGVAAHLAQGGASKCASGGEPAEDDNPESPTGYVYTWPSAEAQAADAWVDPHPSIVQTLSRFRNRDPCGVLESTGTFLTLGNAYVHEIEVPVLVLFGKEDQIFQSPAQELQPYRFAGSSDVTFEQLSNTGHDPAGDRTAPNFRQALSVWLSERGF